MHVRDKAAVFIIGQIGSAAHEETCNHSLITTFEKTNTLALLYRLVESIHSDETHLFGETKAPPSVTQSNVMEIIYWSKCSKTNKRMATSVFLRHYHTHTRWPSLTWCWGQKTAQCFPRLWACPPVSKDSRDIRSHVAAAKRKKNIRCMTIIVKNWKCVCICYMYK